jgi:hypothetical protein
MFYHSTVYNNSTYVTPKLTYPREPSSASFAGFGITPCHIPPVNVTSPVKCING